MKDYLIIGQGLAGSFLACNLIQKGRTVTLVDEDHAYCSSMAAAGMVNPVTGKRLVLSSRCEELLPYAKDVYHKLEEQFNEKFFESKDIIRLFRNEEEIDEWEKKSGQTHLKKYYGEKQPRGIYGNILNDDKGSFIIEQGGYCRKLALMNCFTEYFKGQGSLVNERLCYDELEIGDNSVKWRDNRYSKVVFCEGYQAKDNPWFYWLPFNLAKGEILTLSLKDATLPDAIISCGKWCIPIEDGKYTVGSTYSWDEFDCEINEGAKDEILKEISEFIKAEFKVVHHEAGVRPVMIDLKPAMGLHPDHPSVAIFNGLASKGLIWGPFYSSQMADFLLNGIPLEEEVNIERFVKKYFNKTICQ